MVDVATVAVAAVAVAAGTSLQSATVVTVGTVADSRLVLTRASGVGVVVGRAVVGARTLLNGGDVVTLGSDSVLAIDRAGEGLGSLSINRFLGGLLGLGSTASVERGRGENVVNPMNDTLLSNDVGLEDLCGEVADFDGTCVVVKDDVLARGGDHSSLVNEEGRVEDSGSNNVLTKNSGDVGGVRLTSNELLNSIIARDEEGDTGHRVDGAGKSTVLDIGEQGRNTSVAEEAESLSDCARDSDSLLDGLNGERVELLALAGERTVVNGLSNETVVTRLGKRNGLTSTTGKLREFGAVQERVTNGVQRIAVEVVGVKVPTENMVEQSSLKTGRVGSDPRRELGDGLVGGSEKELLRVVGKNALSDGRMLRENIGKGGEVVVTKTLKDGVGITTLAELKVLELNGLRQGSERKERRDGESELHSCRLWWSDGNGRTRDWGSSG